MRILLFCFASLFFFQTPWEENTNLEGRFQIIAPGKFEEKTDTLATGVGGLVYHTFFHQYISENDENEVYMVSYCDYPEGLVFTYSIGLTEDFFQTTMQAASESVKGEILYETDIQLDEYPGKFWRIDYLDGGATIKTKAYLVKNRYYAVQVIAFHKNSINEITDRFFNSFKLL